MSKDLLATIVTLVEQAIKDAPEVLSSFQAIFSKPNPTPDDWAALKQDILSKSYKDYVPDTSLPDSTTPSN